MQENIQSLSLSLISDTHIFAIFLWYHDVHLRALGTDDVTVEGVLAQVDLAALCLVDGNGGNGSQHLQRDASQLLTGMRGTLCTLRYKIQQMETDSNDVLTEKYVIPDHHSVNVFLTCN